MDATGDNLLARFDSVLDAVNAAAEMQRDLSERNAELPYHRKMEFRIVTVLLFSARLLNSCSAFLVGACLKGINLTRPG